MHFAHANCFPPCTYNAFIQQLTGEFRVLGMEGRALWETQDPAQFQHCREMGEHLARFLLEMRLGSAVAADHSLGAATSLLRLNRRFPLAVRARRRRIESPSREVLLRAYRSARVFNRWQ